MITTISIARVSTVFTWRFWNVYSQEMLVAVLRILLCQEMKMSAFGGDIGHWCCSVPGSGSSWYSSVGVWPEMLIGRVVH